MDVLHTISEMRGWSRTAGTGNRSLALVPTMGYLHAGHLALVRMARQSADHVVVSNFVNPLQFGPSEDYARYPRDLDRDNRLCREAGVDAVFVPDAGDMYPAGASVVVEETRVSSGLCGRMRPGHFRGVATVVAKLFNIVQPDLAVFGRKDAQQVRVIQRLGQDLDFPVRILVHPIVREPDGLAMSSRNVYLSPSERSRALCIRRALEAARVLFESGERAAGVLEPCVGEVLAVGRPDVVEYATVVDWDTLEPAGQIMRPCLLAVAVRFGRTRLIDNILLDPLNPAGIEPV